MILPPRPVPGVGIQPIKMTKPRHNTKWVMGLITLGLLGCTEQAPVIYHEPHVYKGKKDHHGPKANTLDSRFKQTQTDR